MGQVIITGVTAVKEGVWIRTNIPAQLKPNRIPSKETFVSWDTIGVMLFENYADDVDIVERRSKEE